MKIISYLGHTIVASLFDANSVAIDCGANNGHFVTWLSQNSSFKIYSFEADPRLFKLLPKVDRVQFFPMAVTGESGTIELGLGAQSCSSVVFRESPGQETVRVDATSLDDFCKQHQIADISLIKMDIEGAELDVLASLSEDLLSRIRQITVEFHDMQNPEDLPRIEAVVNRLKSFGFFFIRFTQHTWGDCLFINMRTTRLTWLDKMKLYVHGKYLPGIKRIFARMARR